MVGAGVMPFDTKTDLPAWRALERGYEFVSLLELRA